MHGFYEQKVLTHAAALNKFNVPRIQLGHEGSLFFSIMSPVPLASKKFCEGFI